MASLEVYLLNVGQADTSVIRTPDGNVIVIDAYNPTKVKDFLGRLRTDKVISHLIITHPHYDHYNAVDSMLDDFTVKRVTLAPFWQEPGSSGYHTVINKMAAKELPIRFLSGYERLYPDGGSYPDYAGKPLLELLGPSNSLLEELEESRTLTPNHVSIISRLTYGRFSIVFAADAQMENWHQYDRENMLEEKCDVLRASHHGSKRGSQWERIERLSPSLVVVSSDPDGHHHLPDVVGGVIFWELDKRSQITVALTYATGTIRIEVPDPNSHQRNISTYREGPGQKVPDDAEIGLPDTDWGALVQGRMH